MNGYTKCEYINQVEQVDKVLGQQVEVVVLGVKLVLWSCNECGALVMDQRVHTKWHEKK